MAQIISRRDPATGRRREIARVEGDSAVDRRQALADTLGTTPGRAGRLSNDQIANRLTPDFKSFDAPIGTTALGGQPDFDLSTPLSVTGGAEGRLESSLAALPKRLAEERKAAERNEQQSFQGLFSEFLNQDTPSAIRQREESRLGIPELDMQATELSNDLTAEQERLRKEVERIQTAPGTATVAERDRAVSEATRISRRSQADLAITQLAAQGRLDSARRYAETAVQAETEYQQKRLEGFELVYNRNKDLFTKAEQREFETAQEDRKREADLEIFKLKSKYEQEIRQNDPLYQAQIANIYSQIANRQSAANANGTLNGKPQTATQSQVQGYADRTLQSDSIISRIGNQFTGAASLIGQTLPNLLKSSTRQQYEQAQRNFVNAVLRRESGAVISEEEFRNARLQYFPQPGDSAEVVAQKAQNRSTVIDSLYQQANVPRAVTPGTVIESGGKTYEVGDDGETLIEI